MGVVPREKLEKNKHTFPKKVGIVFLERRKRVVEDKHKSTSEKKRGELSLDFDQDACAFLILHMNQHQKIFEFQVVDIPKDRRSPLKERIRDLLRRMMTKPPKQKVNESLIPKKKDKQNLLGWVDKLAISRSKVKIDYWIGITSELLPNHTTWHFDTMEIKKTKSSKRLWIITSKGWEKHRSPPSLFEYLLATVFRCALESMSRQLRHEEEQKLESYQYHRHVTRGCIFDFTHRRISVSIFKLCLYCNKKLSLLGNSIWESGYDVNLVEDVTSILSKEWMGTPERRGTPLYDLKRIYKYDVDRNSGFNKGLRERFRDSIYDKSAEWIVGGILTAIITGGIAIVYRLIG